MLKKYTSNKVLLLMNNSDNNGNTHSETKIKKYKKPLNPKNSEEKNNSQLKNSIFSKVIIKSNSIINNNNEHFLLNYKNKMSIKNSPYFLKNNNQSKNKNHLKTKIKTTFSNYYTDFIFKNNNKQNFNFTEINYGGEETDELSHIQLNNETNEDTLKTNKLKYLGFYNTDSTNKINFNTCINNSISNNNSKNYSPYRKGSIIISPNQNKKISKENKKMFDNSNKKIPKIKIGTNSETKINKNINININNNKNLKILGNKKNKNIIKSKKTNNLKNKKSDEKNKEKKENKVKVFDSDNKLSKKKNIIDNITKERHIFLSPIPKNINNIVKFKSPTKKLNKINYNNYLFHYNNNYNNTNSSSSKENKKIIFQRKENIKISNQNDKNNDTHNKIKDNKENKNKSNPNNLNNIFNKNTPTSIPKDKDKLKLNIDTHINTASLKEDLEVNNIETDIYKLMNEHKELSPTTISEDKTTEKDLYLENNNNKEIKNKNHLIDYFKTARKALKTMSHSLVDPIKNNNNIFDDNEIKNKLNEGGQISNRYKEDEVNNYTIKKVPIFVGVNMFPHKKIKNINFLCNIFSNKSKKNNIKINILNFLDDKSIMYLSSINKTLFNSIRIKFYIHIYNKIYKNHKFIKKINDSMFLIVSNQLKKDKNQLQSLYNSFNTKTSYNDIIINDLYRTFPEDSKFQKNSINYKKLYNILTKYSNYNPIIGYAQGLNFLFANALYLYDNEKMAFFYIDGLIKRFGLENYLAEKNSKLTDEINKFSKILTKYIPDIIYYFDKKLINHEFFSTGWILTLFSNSMNYKNLFIVWNFMIIFGWKFFYCLVIQILIYYKKVIFNADENELNQLMKNLLKDKKFNLDLPKIINNALIFMEKNIIL